MMPRCARLMTPLTAACAATLLVACGSGEEEPQAPGDEQILDKQWQVVSINTTPDAASTIPESIPQAPTLSFGESTLVGTTGCTQMVGKVTYSADEERQNIQDGNRLHFDEVDYDETAQDCHGASVWADNLLRNLISAGRDFHYTVNSNNQLVLELVTDEVDSPSIKLVSLGN